MFLKYYCSCACACAWGLLSLFNQHFSEHDLDITRRLKRQCKQNWVKSKSCKKCAVDNSLKKMGFFVQLYTTFISFQLENKTVKQFLKANAFVFGILPKNITTRNLRGMRIFHNCI